VKGGEGKGRSIREEGDNEFPRKRCIGVVSDEK
jgi:hypothetical protein